MKRVLTALFVTALLSAPAAWAHDDHGHGRGHDKHGWKEWKHERHEWDKRQRWEARHGYYYQQPQVVQQYYYQPPVVYQQPVYQPYYAGPPELSFNFRVPLN